MTQPKPESLPELVERLDKIDKAVKHHAETCGCDEGKDECCVFYQAWPRLRDAVVAMREFAKERHTCAWSDSSRSECKACQLFSRLNAPAPKEPGE